MVDDDGKDVGVDVVGELLGQPSDRHAGLFSRSRADEERDGWFMTGDLARFDANGNLQIAGRKKDVIIRGGHNIYPVRIEDLVMRHDAVAKAAAFPVADERLGERVCLAVIPRTNAHVEAMEMLGHLDAQGLSKYDMPELFLTLEAFPLTPSGKVLKRRLIEMVREGLLRPFPVRWPG